MTRDHGPKTLCYQLFVNRYRTEGNKENKGLVWFGLILVYFVTRIGVNRKNLSNNAPSFIVGRTVSMQRNP